MRTASRSSVILTLVFASTMATTPAAWAGRFAGNRAQLDAIEARARAAQFLTRATFGPTAEEIEALGQRVQKLGAAAAFDQWIEAQFRVPASYHHPLAKQMVMDDGFDLLDERARLPAYRHYAWWHTALTAPDQLRQRMAWALAQIFVISQDGQGFNNRLLDASGEPQYLGVVAYYDMLVRNAFGDYRSTLRDVALHPVMGVYLSHVRNPKGDPAIGRFPDENFARESMQLMSIGLYALERDGVVRTDARGVPLASFDGEQLKALARVWTGLSWARSVRFDQGRPNLHEPMKMFEEWHDTAAKTLVGGVTLPAGQPGTVDVDEALDALAAHPNVGPFLGRLLIQRFVKSNPSRDYIAAVAAAFDGAGGGARGDWKRVLKAILLHPEALESLQFTRQRRVLLVVERGTEWSRLAEPVLRYSAFLRAFAPVSTHPTGRFLLGDQTFFLNQEAYRSPSVFNFYLPNHVPAGELQAYVASNRLPDSTVHAPEFEIFTSVAANRIANRLRADVRDAKVDLVTVDAIGRMPFAIELDLGTEVSLAARPKALLEHLDLLLCQGTLSPSASSTIMGALAASGGTEVERARGAVLAVLTAPDCVIQE
jgi:uncharacterized protein (DUF1800 family)